MMSYYFYFFKRLISGSVVVKLSVMLILAIVAYQFGMFESVDSFVKGSYRAVFILVTPIFIARCFINKYRKTYMLFADVEANDDEYHSVDFADQPVEFKR
jgi:hypothetical protein